MLEHHLGNSFMEKEEIDKKTVIRTNWKKLIKQVSCLCLGAFLMQPTRVIAQLMAIGRGPTISLSAG